MAEKKKTRPKRPSWDAYYMNVARVISTRSNCLSRQVAAIAVKDQRIISTGYNGTPRGTRNCDEGGCERCSTSTEAGTSLDLCRCSHAEENCIVQAAYHGVSLKGAMIYTTHQPCLWCAKMIINAGIVQIIAATSYPGSLEDIIQLFLEAGIKFSFKED